MLQSATVVKMTGAALLKCIGNMGELKCYRQFSVRQPDGDVVDWGTWLTMGKGRNYGNLYVHLHQPSTGQHWSGAVETQVGSLPYKGCMADRVIQHMRLMWRRGQ